MSVLSVALRPAVDTRPPAEEWRGITTQVAVSPDQPPLRLVSEDEELTGPPAPASTAISVDVVPAGVNPSVASALESDAQTWAPWFAQLLVEALEGRRALESLGHWLDEWVLAEVSRRVRQQRRARARTPAAASVSRATVVSLRAQFGHPRVLEVAAHVRRGRRSYACAFQLIRLGDRWRCTALQPGW